MGADVVLVPILLSVPIFSQAAKNTGEGRRCFVSQQLVSVFHAILMKFLSVFFCHKSSIIAAWCGGEGVK